MHIELFTALKSANVGDEKAAEVVGALEEYMAVKISEATAGLEAKLEAQKTALEAQLKAQTWVIGAVGFILAVIGLAPAFVHIFK